MALNDYYIAARFARRDEMAKIAHLIARSTSDSRCVARWVFGGEDGLTRPEIAELDLDDVKRAQTFILFTHKRGTKQPGGGRFVEFGYALAIGKRCIVIGDYENVFCSHEAVIVYPDWETFVLNEIPADSAHKALEGYVHV